MPDIEEIEREYRVLSAKVAYAEFEDAVEPDEARRLEELSRLRVDLTAPDFRVYAASL
jgi:hypothetical protein